MNRRLECTGPLIRMKNSRIPKVALDAKLENERKLEDQSQDDQTTYMQMLK